MRVLLLLLLIAPVDEEDEDLKKWFASQAPAGHAKKDDPLPVDPPPVRIEVPPALSKALPPETIQAIVQGDLTAVQRVRQLAADGVVAGAFKEAEGKKIFDDVKVFAEAAKQARQSPISLHQGNAYRQLVRAAATLEKVGPDAEAGLEVSRAALLDAYEAKRRSDPALHERGTGTRFFSGKGRPSSMDDTSALQRISRDLNRIEVPRPARDQTNAPVNGVKIRIDDAILDQALAAKGRDALLAEITALEDRLLASRDVLRDLQQFHEQKKKEFLSAGNRIVPAADLVRIPLRPLLAARPGHLGVRRIHGFLRDASGDLVLLGRVGDRGDFIRTDDLLTALSSVWRHHRTPLVSLDPDPTFPGGPQHTRVAGIPHDSSFARILLDADYEMKRIVGGLVPIPGVKTIPDLMWDQPTIDVDDRFWLFPVQPGPGEILVGPAGDAALFDLRVQVLTERLAGESGTGQVSPVCDAVARSMTARFDAVTAARPVFLQLRGLFDLVLLARLLRATAPQDGLLAALSAIPAATVPVPAYYPAVVVRHGRGETVVTLSGGCDVDVRLRSRALLQLDELPAALPVPGRDPGHDGDLETAAGLIDQGKFADAVARYDDALLRSPDDAHAFSGRALAEALRGRKTEAVSDASWALRLEPGNPRAQAVMAFILDRKNVLPMLSAAARGELVELLSRRSSAEFEAGREERALALADRAVETQPDEPRPYVERARLKCLRGDFEGVERDVARWGSDPSALVIRARARFHQGKHAEAEADLTAAISQVDLPDLYAFRALVRLRAGRPAAADLRKALASGSASPAVLATANAARLVRSLGPESAWAILDRGLRLPPRVQEAVTTALQASSVAALQKGLEKLGDAGEVRDFLELRLASMSGPAGLARLDRLSERRPTWLSPEVVRAAILLAAGQRAAAARTVEEWDRKSVEGDVALAQFAGSLRNPAAGVEVLRFLMHLEIGNKDLILASLGRLAKAVDSPAVAALRDFFQGKGLKIGSFPADTVEQKLLKVVALAHAAATDGEKAEEHATQLAAVSFASTPNPMADRMVPILRANVLEAVLRKYQKELTKDPRFVQAAAGLKEAGPAMAADFQALEDEWVARAAKVDPVLVFLVRDEVRSLRDRATADAAARTLAQVEKLLEVVLDPKKSKDLEARRDALKKMADDARKGDTVRRLIADSLPGFNGTLDLETFREALTRAGRRRDGLASHYVPPDGFDRKLAESYLEAP